MVTYFAMADPIADLGTVFNLDTFVGIFFELCCEVRSDKVQEKLTLSGSDVSQRFKFIDGLTGSNSNVKSIVEPEITSNAVLQF